MIIVSQDKDVIVNFDGNEAIYIEEKIDKIEIKVRGRYLYSIGKYETEKRAKEVLEEIARECEDCNQGHLPTGYGYVKNAVFYMPKE